MKIISNILKFAVFIGIGVGILYYLYTSLEPAYQEQCVIDGIPAAECSLIDKIFTDFKNANYFWIGIVFLAFTISNISRMVRWGMLLDNLGQPVRRSVIFISVILTYLFNLIFPRLGEVVKAWIIHQYEDISMEKVIGTVFVDRLMDVVSLAIVMGIAMIFEFETLKNFLQSQPKNGEVADPGLPWLWIIFGLGVASLAVLYVFRLQFQGTKMYGKLRSIIKGFIEGIQTIKNLKNPGWFIFHSINVWVMYYFMTYLCFFAFAPTEHLGPKAGLTVYAFSALGVLIPSPGGMGTVHWLAIQALALYGINQIDGLSFANILFFSVQIFYNIGLGIICLLLLGFWIKKRSEMKIG